MGLGLLDGETNDEIWRGGYGQYELTRGTLCKLVGIGKYHEIWQAQFMPYACHADEAQKKLASDVQDAVNRIFYEQLSAYITKYECRPPNTQVELSMALNGAKYIAEEEEGTGEEEEGEDDDDTEDARINEEQWKLDEMFFLDFPEVSTPAVDKVKREVLIGMLKIPEVECAVFSEHPIILNILHHSDCTGAMSFQDCRRWLSLLECLRKKHPTLRMSRWRGFYIPDKDEICAETETPGTKRKRAEGDNGDSDRSGVKRLRVSGDEFEDMTKSTEDVLGKFMAGLRKIVEEKT